MTQRLAELLEEMAGQSDFDQRKYQEFEELLKLEGSNSLTSEAANCLIEFNNYLTARSLITGRRVEPDPRELERLRRDLRLFAGAIRAGITQYKSMKDLQKQLKGGT